MSYLILLENGQVVATENGYCIEVGDQIQTDANTLSIAKSIYYVGNDTEERAFIKAVYGGEFITGAKKVEYKEL